jgi:preprotein translocase subunit SecF
MEYRSFDYTNELGQVELERGSWIGVAVSWVILQSLKIALLVVIAGLGFSVFKYFEPSLAFAAPALSHASH